MRLFILIKILSCFFTNRRFHQQLLYLTHDLREFGEGDDHNLSGLLYRLGQVLISQLLHIERKRHLGVLHVTGLLYTHFLQHNILKVEIARTALLTPAHSLLFLLLLLLEAGGDDQQVLELERLLVVAVLFVIASEGEHLQRPVNVLLQRVVQRRDHLWREVAHALVQQKTRLLRKVRVKAGLELFGTPLSQNGQNLLDRGIVLGVTRLSHSNLICLEMKHSEESVGVLLSVHLYDGSRFHLIHHSVSQWREIDILC